MPRFCSRRLAVFKLHLGLNEKFGKSPLLSILKSARILTIFRLLSVSFLTFEKQARTRTTTGEHEAGGLPKDVRQVRCRGGNIKFRALRLSDGNFSWGSENVTRKARIVDVVYNATNNELLRTKTLVKSAVVAVDATPFRAWYAQHYGKKRGVEARGVPSNGRSRRTSTT